MIAASIPALESSGEVVTGVCASRRERCPVCRGACEPDARFCPNDGAQLTQPAESVRIGSVLGGDIELTGVLGTGATGRVYRGRQRGRERDVAVKVLLPGLAFEAEFVRRLKFEAQVAERLRHPNAVRIFHVGELADGSPYLVMECVDGVSLTAALASAGGALPLDRALAIASALCAVLGAAHDVGIVHRDVKPDNVMLTPRADGGEDVKLLDFGIAKPVSHDPRSFETAAGLVLGTPRYISPEAAQGLPLGPASDVYSIAAVLYEVLSGAPPFADESTVALLFKHVSHAPPDLRSVAPGRAIPSAIAELVMDNLAKNPAHRLPDARAFGEALVTAAQHLDDADTGSSRAVVADEPPEENASLAAADDAPPPAASPDRGRSWRRKVVVAACVAALLAGAFAAFGVVRRRDAAREAIVAAIARRAGGDIGGSVVDAQRAADIDSGSNAARTLLLDYSRELAALRASPDAYRGRALVLLNAPAEAPTREDFTWSATLFPRPRQPGVADVKMAVRDAEGAERGLAVHDGSDGTFTASAHVSKAGKAKLVFDAIIDGRAVHAERAVQVRAR